MRDLYDRLIEESEAGIQRLIDERAQEGLQLDFKQKARPENGAFDDGDRKILAKAISGFANSAGGLIVWGVNAEKVDGVDCAQPPAAPIAQIDRFSSEATTLVGQLIQPRHDGVHIATIRSAVGEGYGYLIIYVERSERRPHRSEAKAQKQYFKRSGDSFFEMEHYDIEDAFNRNRAASLEISFSPPAIINEDTNYRLYGITVCVRNDSDCIAKFPFMSIYDVQNGEIHRPGLGNGHHGLRLVQMQKNYQFLGGADDVVHPQSILQVGVFSVRFWRSGGPWMVGRDLAELAAFSFSYRCGCEGMRPRPGVIRYDTRRFMPTD